MPKFTDALTRLGLTAEDLINWRSANTQANRIKLSPEAIQAANDLESGKIGYQEFLDIVGRAEPYKSVPALTTDIQLLGGLMDNKIERGLLGITTHVPEGKRVASRLDIPAYNTRGAWVETMHEPTGSTKPGPPIGYGKTAHLEDVNFTVGPDEALTIATGRGNKWPFAGMEGNYLATDPEKARRRAVQTRNRDDWTQVGMNPAKSGAFYERGTMRPLEGADEVIQVGPYVQARNPRFIPDDDPRLLTRGSGGAPSKGNKPVRPGVKFGAQTGAAGLLGLGALTDTEEAEAMPLYRAFRGEHGALADAAEKFQTRLGALSFGDAQTANQYAMNPNVRSDVPVQPRVYPSNVRIDNPVINNPEDPFLPFADLEKAVGFDQAKKVFVGLEGMNDSEYLDEILEQYDANSIADLPDEALRQLDVPAFEVFNDPETVQLMKNNGYDGGITAGYGENYDQVEFRPFDESQVSPAFGAHPPSSLGVDDAWREPPTIIPDSGKYVPAAAGATGLGALADTGSAQAAQESDPDAWMYERPALMEGALGGLPESLQAGILAAGKETDKLLTGARDLFGSALGIDEEWRGKNQARQKANDRVFAPVEDEYVGATMAGSMLPYLATGALYGSLGPLGAGLTAAGEGALYYQEDPEDRLTNAALGGGLGFGVGKGLQKWSDRVAANPWRRGR